MSTNLHKVYILTQIMIFPEHNWDVFVLKLNKTLNDKPTEICNSFGSRKEMMLSLSGLKILLWVVLKGMDNLICPLIWKNAHIFLITWIKKDKSCLLINLYIHLFY